MNTKLVLGLLVFMGFLFGCDNDDGGDPPEPQPSEIGQVVVSVPVDTLWYERSNTASVQIIVRITDSGGNPIIGEPIQFSLSNPGLGYIAYLDTILQNRTDHMGEVAILFTSNGIDGSIDFIAAYGGVGTRETLVCRMNPVVTAGMIVIETQSDTLTFSPGDSASTLLTVSVFGNDELPIAGRKVSLLASTPQLGYLEFLNQDLRDTTDAEGQVELRFTATGTDGDAIFSASMDQVTAVDTIACIEMNVVIEVTAGTLYLYWTGQYWANEMFFEAVYRTTLGTPIHGIYLSALSSRGFLLEALPPTNEFGRTSGTIVGAVLGEDEHELCVTVTDGDIEGSDCGEYGN